MPKLFGVHKVELKSGVTAEEFEKFMKEDSSLTLYSGWKPYTLKGIRGERAGQYLILVEIESVEARDRLFTSDGEPSEESKQWDEAHPENTKWMEKFYSLVSGFDETYTDYVELD